MRGLLLLPLPRGLLLLGARWSRRWRSGYALLRARRYEWGCRSVLLCLLLLLLLLVLQALSLRVLELRCGCRSVRGGRESGRLLGRSLCLLVGLLVLLGIHLPLRVLHGAHLTLLLLLLLNRRLHWRRRGYSLRQASGTESQRRPTLYVP